MTYLEPCPAYRCVEGIDCVLPNNHEGAHVDSFGESWETPDEKETPGSHAFDISEMRAQAARADALQAERDEARDMAKGLLHDLYSAWRKLEIFNATYEMVKSLDKCERCDQASAIIRELCGALENAKYGHDFVSGGICDAVDPGIYGKCDCGFESDIDKALARVPTEWKK